MPLLKEHFTIYQLASLFAAIAFFVPAIILSVRKLLRDNLVVWFAAFWFCAGMVNLLYISNIIKSESILYTIDHIYNLADAPFMLFVLYKTTYVDVIKKSLQKILLPFVIIQFLLTAFTGLKGAAEATVVAMGVVIVLCYLVWIIVYHAKGVKHSDFQFAMQFIYFALLFEYGVSIITFFYSYINMPDGKGIDDNFLIFHMGTIITIAIASYGISIYKAELPVKKKKRLMTERDAEIRFL